MKTIGTVLVLLLTLSSGVPAQPPAAPRLRVGVAGLVHGHVGGLMAALSRRPDVELVGVYEPDATLRDRFRDARGLAPERMFADLPTLITTARPEALVVYTSTADHLPVIEVAARHGVHVMVEKPLAVSMAHATAIAAAAAAGGIHVLVNYETTWYPSHRAVWQLMHEARTGGAIRKIVALDGHSGPKAIGVSEEFFDWLTDPDRNGAGALYDFGCYGANIATWLLDDQRPVRVTAVTQQHQPAIYPRVDDEATIVLEYPAAQVIVQASWNWPYNRKDLEVYTEAAAAWATGGQGLHVRRPGQDHVPMAVEPWPEDERDALSYLTAVVRGRLAPAGPTSLRNNMIVSEILDAARESARTGRTITLPPAQ